MKKIVLTGGGTAGHVMPNLALIGDLQKKGCQVYYIGSKNGMERGLVEGIEGVTYCSVRSGKLRRYFSLQNFIDPFLVIAGYFDSRKLLKTIAPSVIFSKGGFVTVPVVMAGKSLRIPTLLHESDYSPGLANRIGAKFADKVLVTFEDTVTHLPKSKAVHTGTPIRGDLFNGNAQKGLELLGFDGTKPVLLCTGGSQGAEAINDALRSNIDALLVHFDIAHLCGKGKIDAALSNRRGYVQIEFANETLPDIFACASIALSRAGANSVFEFLSIGLPALLVPLPLAQSRGDQIQNAAYFEKRGYAKTLRQESIGELTENLLDLQAHREKYAAAMKAVKQNGTDSVLNVIYDIIKTT